MKNTTRKRWSVEELVYACEECKKGNYSTETFIKVSQDLDRTEAGVSQALRRVQRNIHSLQRRGLERILLAKYVVDDPKLRFTYTTTDAKFANEHGYKALNEKREKAIRDNEPMFDSKDERDEWIRLLAAEGKSGREIGKEVGLGKSQVNQILSGSPQNKRTKFPQPKSPRYPKQKTGMTISILWGLIKVTS